MSRTTRGVQHTRNMLDPFSSADITLLLRCNDDRIRHLYIKQSVTDPRNGAVGGVRSIEATARNETKVSYMAKRSKSIQRILIRSDTLYTSGLVIGNTLWCNKTQFSALSPCWRSSQV